MHLEFTAEQLELRSVVRDVLEAQCPISVARERAETGTVPTAVWSQVVELGWTGLTLPEHIGGLGLGVVESVVVAEEIGRTVAPIPWLSTVTQYLAVVCALGGSERYGPEVLNGSIGTLAIAEDGLRASPPRPATVARRTGSTWVIDGVKRWVWEPTLSERIAVVAGTDDGLGLFVVPTSKLQIRPARTLDATREWADVRFDEVAVDEDAALGRPGDCDEGLAHGLRAATLAVAAEIVGVCDQLLERTIDYVRTREQFGVPVGSFQAIKHKLADAYVALERARAATYFAAATLAEADPRQETAVTMAKLAAGDCQRIVVQHAIQCHGGVGYTWESDVHLYAKRAKADDAAFGTAREQRRRLAQLLRLTA